MLNLFRQTVLLLVYSNLFIAACAVLMATATCRLLLHTDVDPVLLRFIFFSTICSYNFHYYFTTPSVAVSPRSAWTRKNRGLVIGLFLAGFAGAAWNLGDLWNWRMWMLPAVIATFLYSAPKIPHPFFQSLKKIAIGKTIFLALVWMYVTTVLPLLVSGAAWSEGFTLYCASRYFFIYSICILFDYRDREDDRINGVRSLVTFLSPRGIRWLFWSSLLLYFLLTLLLHRYGLTQTDLFILLIPGFILALLRPYAMKHFQDLLYYAVLDGLMALSATLMLLARI